MKLLSHLKKKRKKKVKKRDHSKSVTVKGDASIIEENREKLVSRGIPPEMISNYIIFDYDEYMEKIPHDKKKEFMEKEGFVFDDTLYQFNALNKKGVNEIHWIQLRK